VAARCVFGHKRASPPVNSAGGLFFGSPTSLPESAQIRRSVVQQFGLLQENESPPSRMANSAPGIRSASSAEKYGGPQKSRSPTGINLGEGLFQAPHQRELDCAVVARQRFALALPDAVLCAAVAARKSGMGETGI
jgi:hypothetical protein